MTPLHAFTKGSFIESAQVKALHLSLRLKIKQSFIQLINEVQRKVDLIQGQKIIEALDCNQHFSPNLYFYYFSLLEAMMKQNLEKVETIANTLNNLKIENFYSSGLDIKNELDNSIIEFQKKYELEDRKKIVKFKRISSKELERSKLMIFEALSIIEQTNINLFHEINELISSIQILKEYSSGASSSLQYFGMIVMKSDFMTNPVEQLLFYFDTIVHESSHIYLNLLMTFDPIILNAHEEYLSPARKTKRPLKGILHAHFVILRLTLMYQLAEKFLANSELSQNSSKQFSNRPVAQLPYYFDLRLNAYKARLKEGEQIISQYAELTDFGAEFLRCLAKESQNV